MLGYLYRIRFGSKSGSIGRRREGEMACPSSGIKHGLVLAVSKNGYHLNLTHCGRVTQICIFNTVNLSTSASSS